MDCHFLQRCQVDSELRALAEAQVLACEPCDVGGSARFRAHLSDTVLFPEGGGQPSDHGVIRWRDPAAEGRETQARVSDVQRDPSDARVWHTLDRAVPVGARVSLEVDWPRRWDHMTQHSAQHLVSAVAQRTLRMDTLSWSLSPAPQPSYVDLVGPKLSPALLEELETAVNDAILRDEHVRAQVLTPEQFAALPHARVKDGAAPVPASAPLRVVTIGALDANACCGTHVSRLSQLQSVALLRADALRKKGTGGARVEVNRVQFVAGPRAQQHLRALQQQSRDLTDVLGCAPPDHAARARALQDSARVAAAAGKALENDLAAALAPALAASARVAANGGLVAHHRADGSPLFMSDLARLVREADADAMVLASVGADGATGAYVLSGPAGARVDAAQARLLELLGAKGGGRGERFQAKVPPEKMSARAMQIAADVVRSMLAEMP